MQEHELHLLRDALVFLGAAVLIVPLFRKLRSSPVLGYLAAGLVVGPGGLAFIPDAEAVVLLAEFGIVFLLFAIGLELSLARLLLLRTYVFGLGGAQVLVTGALIALAALGLGVGLEPAIVLGGGLALSSTAFVVQLLVERGELASRSGRAGFAILLMQDLAIVPLLALLPLLARPEGSLLAALGLAALKAGTAIAVTVLAGRFVLQPLYRAIAGSRSPELFVATTLLVLLGSGYLMQLSGVSMALGAFLAGLLLSGSEYRHQVEADIRPFRGLLLGLFFMSVGLSIDLRLIASLWWQLPLALAALMLGKAAVIAGLCRLFGLPGEVAVRVGTLLSQGGEFAFVLIGSAMALGLVEPRLGQSAVALVALSMALTPAVAWLGRGLAGRLGGEEERELPAQPGPEAEELHDHVVIAGFGRVGQSVAVALSGLQVPYVGFDLSAPRVRHCRRLDLSVYYGDASRIEVLETVGLERARAAVITLDDPERATRVVEALRAHSDSLPIFVRARDLQHSAELREAGATAVVPETIEASLQLGAIVLGQLGVPPGEVAATMETLRAADYGRLTEVIAAGARRPGDGGA
ncbi:Kef-type potassium/proton antiporter, CPA2 family [Tistlia consotensis]|uniref:Kef-type potassium/proton antiporter, CPA2 family n=1 Tax=Tistlia consotensis USBA 355 TaxID=560819 RepID=A0A1Y6C5A5_9PROT|nr:monovalent cation:proton antiporter-2 (CPA2) family protein [Tistlia consotensis]SMF44611.1 Kef-type potassium/proton antiporter, CPA2 family [Tistlia consotensis USBA 355]SNR43397.1 Kef-type potassium/proton antiporter, CPA2 family [Tistlia consotensis]